MKHNGLLRILKVFSGQSVKLTLKFSITESFIKNITESKKTWLTATIKQQVITRYRSRSLRRTSKELEDTRNVTDLNTFGSGFIAVQID